MNTIAWKLLPIIALFSCGETIVDRPGPVSNDGPDDSFAHELNVAEGSPEALRVLRLANGASFETLDDDVGLDRRAASNIITHRKGDDTVDGTPDDDPFGDLAELDAVPYVGPTAMSCLLTYAEDHASDLPDLMPRIHGYAEESAASDAILQVANTTALDVLIDEIGLGQRPAANIVLYRSGTDAIDATPDDTPFASLSELAAVPYVTSDGFHRLFGYAESVGLVGRGEPDEDAEGQDAH